MVKTFFKNTLKIYTKDIQKICSNWVSLVVLGGLVLLPSLYAWVNIYASWDPYGNTKGIKVGIVNQDKGSAIKEMSINIGEEVTQSLKENESLGWTFFETKEDGLEKVNLGEVYATIIIPEDFSQKMTTLLEEEVEKPELEYYVNQKINAIAPKITDKGASTIQQEITTSFIETVANQLLEMMKEAGVELDKEYPTIQKLEHVLYDVDSEFPKIDDKLDYLISKAQDGKVVIDRQDQNVVGLQGIIGKVITFNEDITTILEKLGSKPDEVIPQVKENLILIQTIFSDISRSTLELGNQIELDKPALIRDIDGTINKIENMKQRVEELASKAAELDKNLSQTITDKKNDIINTLEEYIDTLEELKSNIDTPEATLKVLKRVEEINNKLAQKLNKFRMLIQGIGANIDQTLAKLQKVLEKIESIIVPKEQTTEVTEELLNEGERIEPNEIINEEIDSKNNEELTAFMTQINEATELVNATQESLATNEKIYQEASINLNEMNQTLDEIKGLEGNLEEQGRSVEKLKGQARGLSSVVENIRIRIETKIDGINEKLTTIEEMMREIANLSKGVQNLIRDITSGSKEKIASIIDKIEEVEDRLGEIAEQILEISEKESIKIDTKVEAVSKDLTLLQEKLRELQENIASKDVVEKTLINISKLTYNIDASLQNISDKLDQDLISRLKEEIGDVSTFIGDINELLLSVQTELDQLRTLGEKIQSKGELLVSDITKVQEKLPGIHEKISGIVDKVKAINEKIDIKEVIKQSKMDNSDKSNFLAAPVILNTHELYPMANYGAAMTPFYTTLCLWVGALLLTALLTTKSKNVTFEYTPVQEYFGKYLLFATLAAMQGFIASTGDIIVLGVEAKHPVLLVTLAVFYSIIFTGIVYTLVSLFGNVGKSIGVVLLVLQLAGAGGTFPVQVTPQFFQRINSFLPFTYAIGGMREAIAGVVYEALIVDIMMLLVFWVVFIIIGVLLKQKANKFLHKFAKKLVESGIIEH